MLQRRHVAVVHPDGAVVPLRQHRHLAAYAEDKVLKIAFMILTLFTGPLGAFFYVLGCREPLPGTHEVTWPPGGGRCWSTMHCAAGDGVGIIVGAAIGAVLMLSFWRLRAGVPARIRLRQGVLPGLRHAADGRRLYRRSLRMTFLPELLSMNLLMAGMR